MVKIEIGTITKPQGLKGEFRVKHYPETLKVFSKLKQIEFGGKTYSVLKVVDRGGFFVITTKELTSIEQVESLRNLTVYAYVSNELARDVNNNVGYTVVANNEVVGIVVDVKNYGATDVYFLDNERTFACVPNLIEKIDDENKTVFVNESVLQEVIVWK